MKHHFLNRNKPVPPNRPVCFREWEKLKPEGRATDLQVPVKGMKCSKRRHANAEIRSAFWTANLQFQRFL